jgi:ribonucleotide reductase beta subunit family protein with ferritin-like domain
MAQQELKPEPILIPDRNRYISLPIKYHDIHELYLKHESTKWFPESIKIEKDLKGWRMLDNDKKTIVKNILAFFAAADGIVMENINANFATEVQWKEVRMFYTVQNYMEMIHGQTYANILDAYITDLDERNKLFNAIEHMPAIKAKALWAEKWITNDAPFAKRLLAFAIVEGLFFSTSFAFIYFLMETNNGLNELGTSNEYIAADEGLHVEFAALLYRKYIVNKLSPEEVYDLIHEAVAIEKSFVEETIPEPIIGMNTGLMFEYVEYVAKKLAIDFGYKDIYKHAKNPFPFMDKISLQKNIDFFASEVTEYNLSAAYKNTSKKLVLLNDF